MEKQIKNNRAANTGTHEIVISRELDAPRALVWKAWTDPEHIEEWWGPEGFSTEVEELDLKEGGKWRYVMIGQDGKRYPSEGVFKEIVKPDRITSTDEFGEDFENSASLDLPHGIIVTTLFEDLRGKTELTVRIMHRTAEDKKKHQDMGVMEGWNSSLDCLQEYLENNLTEK
ncbi:MAG TPA: hypothetical protein ENO22_03210 [candidate division Zixibacteria bacterium]|nr:hypothetical protein [candidate division Zixibacteria bacterium]HEQ98332.1 hypothetical protein [candidate division Zixibacteria bacterium]